MGSNSGRKSGSWGRSTPRKRVVIGAEETVRVRYRQDVPHVESERHQTRARTGAGRGDSGERKAGKKLSSAKRKAREMRQRSIRRRRSVVVALLLLLLGTAVWGISSLTRSPAFSVDRISVTGASHHTTESVEAIMAVPADSTLPSLSTRRLRKRLEADPWIASARVERDYPHTLVVKLTERVPAAVVDRKGSELWVVSTDGRWLSPRSAEDTGLVLVRGTPPFTPRAGSPVAEPEIANAVRIIRGLSSRLLATVSIVSAPSVEETSLLTREDVEIFVGRSTEMAKKDRVIREILRKQKGSVVYINVRVPDRPTWRGLEQQR